MAEAHASSPPRQAGSSRGSGLQKKLPETLKAIARSLPRGTPLRILFQDEGRFGRISDGRSCWAPLPLRPVIGSQIVREYIYAYVAVSPRDGQMVSLILPWVDAKLMSLFLAQAAAEFPGEHCVMFLDGAGWHKAHELVVPPNMTLVPLPPYSPDLNPAEHVWDYIRENDMRNEVFPDLDKVMDAVETSLHRLHEQPDILQSMTAFPWIMEAVA
ncbi:MAG TPA: IS630 family transposase [Geothrix sp.]